ARDCRECDLSSLGAADPVGLHRLDFFRPVELFESAEQAIRILRYPKHPLIEFLLCDFGSAALAPAIHDVFIGDAGFAARTPVHRHEGFVSQAGVEHLHEDPLRPFVIVRIGRVDFARPVVHSADLLKLALEIFDVSLCADGRMNAFLNRIIFGWRAERVPTHRMEHIETLEPLVPRPAIRQDITAPVSYVQSGTRRVRKHIETIIFRAWIIVLRLVNTLRSPVFAPLRLDFPRAVVFSRHNPMIITYPPGCLCWVFAIVRPQRIGAAVHRHLVLRLRSSNGSRYTLFRLRESLEEYASQ